MRTENIVKVSMLSGGTVKRAVTKLIILPALLLVTQHLVSCSHKQHSSANTNTLEVTIMVVCKYNYYYYC